MKPIRHPDVSGIDDETARRSLAPGGNAAAESPRRNALKKVILSPDIRALLTQRKTSLDRSDIELFTADTNEEALMIHRAEQAHLIISQLKRSGMSSRELCSIIREDPGLSRISIMLICANIPSELEECARCRANAVLTRPPNAAVLLEKAQELLSISSRTAYRCLLSVAVESIVGKTPFFCKSENISATGMLIETDQALAIGDRVSCSFFLPGGSRITATADVVREAGQAHGSGAVRFGLRFTGISPESGREVERFIQQKMSPSL